MLLQLAQIVADYTPVQLCREPLATRADAYLSRIRHRASGASASQAHRSNGAQEPPLLHSVAITCLHMESYAVAAVELKLELDASTASATCRCHVEVGHKKTRNEVFDDKKCSQQRPSVISLHASVS